MHTVLRALVLVAVVVVVDVACDTTVEFGPGHQFNLGEMNLRYPRSFVEPENLLAYGGVQFQDSSALASFCDQDRPPFFCNLNCNCNLIRLTSALGRGFNDVGTSFYQQIQDLSLGFETSYQYFFIVNDNNTNYEIGNGFSFSINGDSATILPDSGTNLGLLDSRYSVGVATFWDQTLGQSRLITPKVAIRGGLPITSPQSVNNAWFGPVDYGKLVNFTVKYNGLPPTPYISVYGDNGFVLGLPIDLSRYYSKTPDNPTKKGYVGFSAGSGTEFALGQYISRWKFRVYEKANIYVSCPGGHTVYVNGVALGSSTNSSYGTAVSYLSSSIVPDAVVAFEASPNGANGQGCLVEVRDNHGFKINDAVGNQNVWKCSSTAVPNWASPSFNDASWANATVIGKNDFEIAYSDPRTAPYKHVANMHASALRIWGSSSTSSAYCRFTLPKFCSSASNANCRPSPRSRGECNTATNLCYCPAPWLGELCDTMGDPSIQQVTPTNGSVAGGTPIKLFGGNFSETDKCVFNGVPETTNTTQLISFTEIWCVTPPSVGQATGPIPVSLLRDDGRTSNSVTFTYTPHITVTGVSPLLAKINERPLVTVTGTGFSVGSSDFFCRFGHTSASDFQYLVPATIISTTQLTCVAPEHPPALLTVEVTRNRVDFYFNTNFPFTFYDVTSPFCRNYRTNAQTRGTEFPFVTDEQQLPGVDPNSTQTSNYQPINVAYGSNATVTLTYNNEVFFNPNELHDEDFCCNIQGANDGMFCGVNFDPSHSESQAEVVIQLRTYAYVNELVTSWYDPCRNLPPAYKIHYEVTDGVWQSAVDRKFNESSPCVTAPSDNGAVALCVDYFQPRITRRIKLSFDNSQSELPLSTAGGWLYEIAVQGKFLDVPHSIGSKSSAWTGSTPVSVTSAAQVAFPAFGLAINNINKTDITNIVTQSYPVKVALYRAVSGKDVLVTDMLQGDLTDIFDGTSNPLFTNLTLKYPLAGNYTLVFRSADNNNALTTLSLPFVVVAGAPSTLRLGSSANVFATASLSTPLGDIFICVDDVSGNPTSATNGFNVSVNTATVPLSGTLQRSLTGVSCINFGDLTIPNAQAGPYALVFSHSDGVQVSDVTVNLLVVEGIPYAMSFLTVTSNVTDNNGPLDPQPVIRVVDVVGNLIGLYGQQVQVRVIIEPKDRSTTRDPLNTNNTVQVVTNGEAQFTHLSFKGQRGHNYTLTFVIEGTLLSLTRDIYVYNCSDLAARRNSVLSTEGYDCVCRAGYAQLNSGGQMQCDPCRSGMFKALDGDFGCVSCEGNTDTDGKIGATNCVCKKGYWQVRVETACLDCPEGGVCEGGQIVGTQAGYWRPDEIVSDPASIVFYPCHRGNPSLKEEDAAKEACPGGDLQPSCGPGYDGVSCLSCADDYGHSGPYCTECPQSQLNYFIVAICAALLLAFLIFMVRQGSTPKNKESVSMRILVNHVQMLALLSAVGAAWNDPFQTMLLIGGMTTFVDTNYVTTDCAFNYSFYTKFLFFILIPLLTIVITAIIYLVIYLVKVLVAPCFSRDDEVVVASKVRSQLLSQYILAVAVITFIAYPAVCIKVLEMFDCTIEIEGKSYLNVSPNDECGTAEYNTYFTLAWVMLVVFCIGTPLLVLFMLYKFRSSTSPHVQMVLRFFHDGYKPDRFFWEIVIILRKFLVVVAIIIGRSSGALNQIYGFVVIVQAALLIHIVFRPYISGRQFRLELWSLLAILVTLGVSLYIPTLSHGSPAAYVLSSLAMLLNLLVIVGFIFFIGRGLTRRLAPKQWSKVVSCWGKLHSKAVIEDLPRYERTKQFFEAFGTSTKYDRDQLYENLEKWWKQAPNYKRRRLMGVLTALAKQTPFQEFATKGLYDNQHYSIDRDSVILNDENNDHSSDSESDEDSNQSADIELEKVRGYSFSAPSKGEEKKQDDS